MSYLNLNSVISGLQKSTPDQAAKTPLMAKLRVQGPYTEPFTNVFPVLNPARVVRAFGSRDRRARESIP